MAMATGKAANPLINSAEVKDSNATIDSRIFASTRLTSKENVHASAETPTKQSINRRGGRENRASWRRKTRNSTLKTAKIKRAMPQKPKPGGRLPKPVCTPSAVAAWARVGTRKSTSPRENFRALRTRA